MYTPDRIVYFEWLNCTQNAVRFRGCKSRHTKALHEMGETRRASLLLDPRAFKSEGARTTRRITSGRICVPQTKTAEAPRAIDPARSVRGGRGLTGIPQRSARKSPLFWWNVASPHDLGGHCRAHSSAVILANFCRCPELDYHLAWLFECDLHDLARLSSPPPPPIASPPRSLDPWSERQRPSLIALLALDCK